MSITEQQAHDARRGDGSQTSHRPVSGVDYTRWPDLRPARRAVIRAAIAKALLRKVANQTGIRVEMPDGSHFGRPTGPVMRVCDEVAMFDRVGRLGKIGFGEAYMAGEWDAPDLEALLEPMGHNLRTLVPPRLQWIRRIYEPRLPDSEDNDRIGSRRNISRHYDLSNNMFSLFLDETMTYSAAMFESSDEPLEAAQGRKIERLLDATAVRSGSRVLEIGTGWGELALRAARRGAHVTTVTLSKEQAALARERIQAAGLADSVDIRIEDYRDASGSYDAVVSVEMIEAVGESWWPTYFKTLEKRLAPGGRVGVQSILMKHETMVAARRSWTWIHKYIFPGGIIPSLEAFEQTVTTHTKLRILNRHHFGHSYAETLRIWRERFDQNATAIDALGFDRTFRRMWEFYLAYSEAGFRSRQLDVAQFVLGREGEI
jgi:cyclopropane-fatty-acyl-phospholipid synthase